MRQPLNMGKYCTFCSNHSHTPDECLKRKWRQTQRELKNDGKNKQSNASLESHIQYEPEGLITEVAYDLVVNAATIEKPPINSNA